MASRPHIGLAFKRLHEARALNAYLLAEYDRSRAGTDASLDTRVTLKAGGQGQSTTGAAGPAKQVPSPKGLTWSPDYAKLVKRARQATKRDTSRRNGWRGGREGDG